MRFLEVTIMPLTMASVGEKNIVRKIIGKEEIRHFLESLGFVNGSEVTIINEMAGNVIVNIKDTRVAISKTMANKILV